MTNQSDPKPSSHEPAPGTRRGGGGQASGRWVVAGILATALIVGVVELKYRRPPPRRIAPPATAPAEMPGPPTTGAAAVPP